MPRLTFLLTYAKYLGPAPWAYALSRRTFVLHSDGFRVLDLNLPSAFHAICLHLYLLVPTISIEDNIKIMTSQYLCADGAGGCDIIFRYGL